MQLPATTRARWPTVKAGRFAESIRHDSPEGCELALLGLPDDLGVRLNGGRPGAAQGPESFRAALANFGTPWDGLKNRRLSTRVFDAGDVIPAVGHDEAALIETHARVEAAVFELHRLGLTVVCVGGGHDLAYPSIAALSRHAAAPLGGINLDAHLDVRERVGSGMPFRRLIDTGAVAAGRFVEAGLGRFANDESDLAWAMERGVRLVFAEEIAGSGMPAATLLQATLGTSPSFVSVDLDGFDSASAPGVSAPSPLGLSVIHGAALSELAGAEPSVLHFGLMELNPAHDVDSRTARVAALLFLYFLTGFATRPR